MGTITYHDWMDLALRVAKRRDRLKNHIGDLIAAAVAEGCFAEAKGLELVASRVDSVAEKFIDLQFTKVIV